MSSGVSNAIRLRRFRFKEDVNVRVVFETAMGDRYDLSVKNCSMTGVGASAEAAFIDQAIQVGSIIPTAKLTISGQEFSLGRLGVRSMTKTDTEVLIGLSCMDTKVPLDGALAKYLDHNIQSNKTPYDFELSPDKFTAASFLESAYSSNDVFTRAKQFSIFLAELENHPKFAFHNVRLPSKGTRVRLDRERKGRRDDYIIFGSNDYYGLSSHPRVEEAAKKAIDDYGIGATGSPVTTGITELHEQLCEKLAKMFGKEKAVLFNSGYTANVGIINSLTTPADLVLADILSHASIQDGLRMCPAKTRLFKHNSAEHLETLLKNHRDEHAGALIIAEGIFSMDGDIAPVDKMVKLAEKYSARLMVDEAHSFGLIGKKGLGAAEHHGVLNKVDIIMGTFSKTAGSIGGFACGSKEVIDWMYYFARSHMFSVSLPPMVVAATLEALTIFEEQPQLRSQLAHNIEQFAAGARELGFDIPMDHKSSIVPIIVGDEKKLGDMNQILIDSGIFVVPIMYPAVSRKEARFRFTIMATHTTADIDFTLSVLERAVERVGLFKSEGALTRTGG